MMMICGNKVLYAMIVVLFYYIAAAATQNYSSNIYIYIYRKLMRKEETSTKGLIRGYSGVGGG
jgi:hypothetical protein